MTFHFDPEEHLFKQIEAGSCDEVENLIKDGVDIDARDDDGKTPLHAAAIANNAQIIELLLIHGADFTMSDYSGRRAAEYTSDEALVDLLTIGLPTPVEQEAIPVPTEPVDVSTEEQQQLLSSVHASLLAIPAPVSPPIITERFPKQLSQVEVLVYKQEYMREYLMGAVYVSMDDTLESIKTHITREIDYLPDEFMLARPSKDLLVNINKKQMTQTLMQIFRLYKLKDYALVILPVQPPPYHSETDEEAPGMLLFSADVSCDYEMQICFIGDSGVGKSCILMRFSENNFSLQNHSTIGVDLKVCHLQVDNKVVRMQIWDTAGQERFRAITRSYFRGKAAVIVVYDVTDRKSFDNIRKWYREIKSLADAGVMIILVGNKCDVESGRQVDFSEGLVLAEELNVSFFESSAKSNLHIIEIFTVVARTYMKQHSMIRHIQGGEIRLDMNNVGYSSCCSR